MLILRPHRQLILPAVPKSQWRPSSQPEFKDQFGNPGIRTRFRIRALARDGSVRWCGWFDDRDDADAFLWAAVTDTLRLEPALWDLPNVAWSPDIGPWLRYDFATTVNLTTTGSQQTYTSPVDWGNANNTVETVGGGGSGGFVLANDRASGGAGGAWSRISNFTFATPGTTTAGYRVAAGGVARSSSSQNGAAGEDTWWNGTTVANGSCTSKGGAGGNQSPASASGATGGAAASGVGTEKSSGGNSAGAPTGIASVTGGGSAGPNTNGGTGNASTYSSGAATSGGADPSGPGGAGGAASNSSGTSATAGSTYGGAGGAFANSTSSGRSSGAGAQGVIILIYTPPSLSNLMLFFV